MTVYTPPITVTRPDYDRLVQLAHQVATRSPAVAEFLSEELERASVVPAAEARPDVVTMGARVRFRMTPGGREREVTLVFPGDADLSANRISILTPVGVALLGLSPGQSLTWTDPGGHERTVTVLEVKGHPATGHETPGRHAAGGPQAARATGA